MNTGSSLSGCLAQARLYSTASKAAKQLLVPAMAVRKSTRCQYSRQSNRAPYLYKSLNQGQSVIPAAKHCQHLLSTSLAGKKAELLLPCLWTACLTIGDFLGSSGA